MKSFLTIIRHGETEWNVAMRLQGNSDSALTEKGLKQAELVAKVLQPKKFDVIISSDQKRAYRTAEIISRYHGLTVIKDPNIRERNFGIMEGLTREEILDRHPKVYKGYMKRKEKYQIPSGESLVHFYKRVTDGLNQIVQAHEGKRILLVTHGGVLDCVMRLIFDIPLGMSRQFTIHNTSINNFLVQDHKWILEAWGNIDHLAGLDSSDEINY